MMHLSFHQVVGVYLTETQTMENSSTKKLFSHRCLSLTYLDANGKLRDTNINLYSDNPNDLELKLC